MSIGWAWEAGGGFSFSRACQPSLWDSLPIWCCPIARAKRSEEHTSELQSRLHLVCRLLLEKKKLNNLNTSAHTFQSARPYLLLSNTFSFQHISSMTPY